MSIHGNQKFLPFMKSSAGPLIDSPGDYVIGLKMLLDQKNSNESFTSFARLAWPLIIVSGDPSSHIIFDDVNKPFAYLQAYSSGGGSTYCANGYICANFLKTDKTPADPNNLPTDGYYVCIRGTE